MLESNECPYTIQLTSDVGFNSISTSEKQLCGIRNSLKLENRSLKKSYCNGKYLATSLVKKYSPLKTFWMASFNSSSVAVFTKYPFAPASTISSTLHLSPHIE